MQYNPSCSRIRAARCVLFPALLLLLACIPGAALAQSEFEDVDSYYRVVPALPDGSLLLHAEDGRAIGEEIEYMPEWQAYGWFTSTSYVEWDVVVDREAAYDVYLEWSVSDEQAGKPYAFTAGEEEITGIVERTGGWLTYSIEKIGEMGLEPGSYTMTFRPMSEFGPEDALLDLRGVYLVPKQEVCSVEVYPKANESDRPGQIRGRVQQRTRKRIPMVCLQAVPGSYRLGGGLTLTRLPDFALL